MYRDSARMNASIQVRNAERYRIYEITTAAGTTVREFVSPTGTVLWDCLGRPFSFQR